MSYMLNVDRKVHPHLTVYAAIAYALQNKLTVEARGACDDSTEPVGMFDADIGDQLVVGDHVFAISEQGLKLLDGDETQGSTVMAEIVNVALGLGIMRDLFAAGDFESLKLEYGDSGFVTAELVGFRASKDASE